MDLLPFPLIRPSVLLLSRTLSAHFKSRPRDGLLPTLTELLFTATNSQHPAVCHATLLEELTHHLTLPRPSLTAPVYANVVCGSRPVGSSMLCAADHFKKMEAGTKGNLRDLALSGDAAGTVSAEQAYKPVVFSLPSARRLLLAIQALPDAYTKEREFLEYLLVTKHLMEEDEFHMVQAGRAKQKKTVEAKRWCAVAEEERRRGVHSMRAVGEAPLSSSVFSSFSLEEKERHEYGDGDAARVDTSAAPLPSLVRSTASDSFLVASSTADPPCAWWRWWEPVKTAPPATYDFDGDVVEEEEEEADEEAEREWREKRSWSCSVQVDGVDRESGQRAAARATQRGSPKTIDIEWKDRPTFWGIVAQLRQRELVEATMQAFQLEEHELESSAMQSNVVVQQRVLAYLCSTSTRIEPEYFQCPIPFLSTDALLSAAQAVALPLSRQLQPSSGTSLPSPSSLSSILRSVHDVITHIGGKQGSADRYPHVPVLCRSLSSQFTPLFLLQHYLGEDTAWRWCAEAFLHLQTGRIAKAGATNTMRSGDGGNSAIVPAASSINAPTASEELLSIERTLSSAPADLLPSFSVSASSSLRSGSSTSVSGGSSSTSISFLRVGAVYSTTLLLASLTKHWPQDILPSELLSSSLSSSLVGTAGCSDYFVSPNMRMLYEMAAVMFALKPEESIPIPIPDKYAVDDAERPTYCHASTASFCPTEAMQEKRKHSLAASSALAGRGVTTLIPLRVQTALQPVLRQTLWYFHSQSRLHDIADFYLFSSSWLHDFTSPAAPFPLPCAYPFDWRSKKKKPALPVDGEEAVPKVPLLLPEEENKKRPTGTSKTEDREGDPISMAREERVTPSMVNHLDNITVKQLMWVQQQCRWKGWLEHHVWLFPVLVNTSRSQLGAAACTVAAVSHPLCSVSSLGGGDGGGVPGSFTLPPPPKPTGLSASAAAALSLETLLSGLFSAVMLWQHSIQTDSSLVDSNAAPDFFSSDAGEEMKSALHQSIQVFLRSLSTQYLPPLSSSISSANRRKIGMASNWAYHHVVYLLVALNTLLFPSTHHVAVATHYHSSLEWGTSTPRVCMEKAEKESVRADENPIQDNTREAMEETRRRRRPLSPLSFPDMAPLLEFCQEQLLTAEGMPPHGYLSEKASTREVSSLLLYASELLQSDVAALVEELRLPLGAQKAKRRRDRHQTVSSASRSQRALYPIYERCWKLVSSRATQGGFSSEALQLLLWKALTTTSSSCFDDPDGEPLHHYFQFVYSNTDTDNASFLPPLMAISSLQTAVQQLPRRSERPLHS